MMKLNLFSVVKITFFKTLTLTVFLVVLYKGTIKRFKNLDFVFNIKLIYYSDNNLSVLSAAYYNLR